MFQKSLAYLSITEKELNQNSSVHFLCGVSASTCATVSSYPFDVIRTRLVAQKSNQVIFTPCIFVFFFSIMNIFNMYFPFNLYILNNLWNINYAVEKDIVLQFLKLKK